MFVARRRYCAWAPCRLTNWSATSGVSSVEAVSHITNSKRSRRAGDSRCHSASRAAKASLRRAHLLYVGTHRERRARSVDTLLRNDAPNLQIVTHGNGRITATLPKTIPAAPIVEPSQTLTGTER